jgi:hypothetical protein
LRLSASTVDTDGGQAGEPMVKFSWKFPGKQQKYSKILPLFFDFPKKPDVQCKFHEQFRNQRRKALRMTSNRFKKQSQRVSLIFKATRQSAKQSAQSATQQC